jgi:hypothetical protein
MKESALAPGVAIIDELRRAQSPVRRGLRGIRRVALFLVRPEILTAYATSAAAIAAFLSVVAAYKQERATFASALYGKQVDVLANIDLKVDRFLEFVQKNAAEAYKREGTPRLDAYKDEIATAGGNLREALYSAEVVYPKEAMHLLDEAAESTHSAVVSKGLWNGLQGETLGERASEAGSVLNVVFDNIYELRECSKLQLRDGQNIDGSKLSACFVTEKARHKTTRSN